MLTRLISLVGMFLLFTGFTLSWDPVTTYVDNTPIDIAAVGGIFYHVEMDNVVVAVKIPITEWLMPPVAKKSMHTFRVMAEDGIGEVSDWSVPFVWTSPPGVLVAPGGMNVRP